MLKKNYLRYNTKSALGDIFLRRYLFLAIFVFGTWIAILAQKEDSFIITNYENGMFETEAYIEPEASLEIMRGIVLDIDTLFRRIEIDSLEWAIKGLSGKEEGKNFLRIDLKDAEYDPKTNLFDFFIDIYVSIIKRQFNVRVTVLMKTGSDQNGNPFMAVEVYNPNFFLKKTSGTFSILQTESKKQFVVKTSVSFGWFFNLFISTSNYNSVAEWRIQTFLENIKTEAESRQKLRY